MKNLLNMFSFHEEGGKEKKTISFSLEQLKTNKKKQTHQRNIEPTTKKKQHTKVKNPNLEGKDGGIMKNRVLGLSRTLSRKWRTQNKSLGPSRQLHSNNQRVHLGRSSRSASGAKARKTGTRSGKKKWKESERGTQRREFKRSKTKTLALSEGQMALSPSFLLFLFPFVCFFPNVFEIFLALFLLLCS